MPRYGSTSCDGNGSTARSAAASESPSSAPGRTGRRRRPPRGRHRSARRTAPRRAASRARRRDVQRLRDASARRHARGHVHAAAGDGGLQQGAKVSEVEVAKATTFQCKPRNHETTKNGMPPTRRQGSERDGSAPISQRTPTSIVYNFGDFHSDFPEVRPWNDGCLRVSVLLALVFGLPCTERCPVEDSRRDLGVREQRANELVVLEGHGPGGPQQDRHGVLREPGTLRRRSPSSSATSWTWSSRSRGWRRRAPSTRTTAAKVGKILGVKYIILGGIDKFNVNNTQGRHRRHRRQPACRPRRPSTCASSTRRPPSAWSRCRPTARSARAAASSAART